MIHLDEYFWQASIAFQSHRYEQSGDYLRQALEYSNRSPLIDEQVELISTVISRILHLRRRSIERLVDYHQSMPMETDETFDRLTKCYVETLECEQATFCQTFLDLLPEHSNVMALRATLYLHLSNVSRPYASKIFDEKSRTLFSLYNKT